MGPAAIFPSLGDQMDHCVYEIAVYGPCSYFSFIGCPNGPLCKWNSCIWAPQLFFLHRVPKWTTVWRPVEAKISKIKKRKKQKKLGFLGDQLDHCVCEIAVYGPAAIFPSSGPQMDHCVGEIAVYGPRSYFSFIGCPNGPLCGGQWKPKRKKQKTLGFLSVATGRS
jgi:hypothetical protein